MKFSQLALYIKQIEEVSSRLEITRLLAQLFQNLSAAEIDKVVYLLQGRVAPQYTKLEFGMAEKSVIKTIVTTFQLEPNLFYKQYKKLGDLGETAEFFKNQSRSFEEREMEASEVFVILKQLAQIEGEGAQKNKQSLLAQLLQQLNPLSCRFLVRIPLGVLRLGFSDMTVLDAYSWMLKGDKSIRAAVEKAYHVRPDLGWLGKVLKEKGDSALKNITPQLFTPIIMMRAERLSSGQEIIDQIGECAVEPKYDGFRLQAHYQKKSGTVKLYSRNLEEVSPMYPDIIEGIKKQIAADKIIIEGEAVGIDQKTGRFLPFQETVSRKRKYNISEKVKEIPLRFFVFELLYADGVSYLEIDFKTRRQKLQQFVKNNNNIICLTPETLVDNPAKIEQLFDEAIEVGLEGILAKKLDGIYQPGARGWNWIKFKRSYSAKINDTIDCLVMGYDLGKGKRTGFGIGAFLVGIYDEKNSQYLTVAKIGTGLTDEEWKQLKVKSKKLRVKSKPKQYQVDRAMYCDVWLEPKLVVEIRADEITRSPVHTAGKITNQAGYALRFPRLERFRRDKGPTDITTLKEVISIYSLRKP